MEKVGADFFLLFRLFEAWLDVPKLLFHGFAMANILTPIPWHIDDSPDRSATPLPGARRDKACNTHITPKGLKDYAHLVSCVRTMKR